MNKKKDILRKQFFPFFENFRQNSEIFRQNILEIKLNFEKFLKGKNNSSGKLLKIMAYKPFKIEFPVLDVLQQQNLIIYYPLISGVDLLPVDANGSCLDIQNIDLIITPALYVDENGFRLGRGRGYYDRLLEKFSSEKTVFIGFEWQVLSEIPREPHDKSVGFIITEAGVRSCFDGEK